MRYAQQCICRRVLSRRFYREIRTAVGDDEDEFDVREPGRSPLSCLELTEYSVDRLLAGLAHDRAAEHLFGVLVEGDRICLDRFWLRFPATLMTWVRSCQWQKTLGRVDLRKLDAQTQRMLRRINRDVNAELARRLDQQDLTGLASRIDHAAGLDHTNIVTIYTVAYILRKAPTLWRQFQSQLSDLKHCHPDEFRDDRLS